jgi:ferredoxin/flavodoxin
MQKIGIFYFSGTGNTAYVTHLLQKSFETHKITVDCVEIRETMGSELERLKNIENEYDLRGFGYSVHAFSAPLTFIDFIKKKLPEISGGGQKNCFLIKTAGDCFMQGGSTHIVRNTLKKRGYHVIYEKLFVMPANVFLKFPPAFIKQLYGIAGEESDKMAQALIEQKTQLQRNSLFLRISTRLFSYFEGKGAKKFGLKCKVSDACTLCMKCVNDCPTNSIIVSKNKIKFTNTCVFCMKCIYNCPTQAITNKFFKMFVIQESYSQKNNLRIVNDPSIPNTFLTPTTKGFYRHYFKYFKKIGVLK